VVNELGDGLDVVRAWFLMMRWTLTAFSIRSF